MKSRAFIVSWILAALWISSSVCLIPVAIPAHVLPFCPADTATRWITEHELKESRQILAQFQFFTDGSMKEAYGTSYGIIWESIIAQRETTRRADADAPKVSSSLAHVGVGLQFSQGEALQSNSDWTVHKADLSMIAFPISVTGILPIGEEEGLYVGLGIGFYLGFERMSGNVENRYTVFEWVDTCYRHSFAAHALLGTYRKTIGRYSLVGELRWTQGGKGRLKRATLSDEQIAVGYGKVFDDFRHPDFNFTGPSINVGVRW